MADNEVKLQGRQLEVIVAAILTSGAARAEGHGPAALTRDFYAILEALRKTGGIAS